MWKFVGIYHNGAAFICSKNSSTVSIPRFDRPGCRVPKSIVSTNGDNRVSWTNM